MSARAGATEAAPLDKPQIQPTPAHRFLGLDLLRGVAAMMVLVWHVAPTFRLRFNSSADLAVDFFFQLSGFVLASAYEAPLRSGMTAQRFMLLRIVRLYPLYFLGCVVASVTLPFITTIFPGPFALSVALTLLMLPTLFGLIMAHQFMDASFPINVPAWSLSFELIINLVYGLFHALLTNRIIIVLMSLSIITITLDAFRVGDVSGGATISSFWAGFPRVTFSFLFGVLLFRLHSKHERSTSPLWLLLAAALLVVVLGIVLPPHWRPVIEVAIVTLVLPFIVWIGADARPVGMLARISTFMGMASYGIYILQRPILMIARRWVRLEGVAGVVAACAIVVVVATLCTMLFDIPLRRTLMAALKKGKAASGMASFGPMNRGA